MKSTPEIDVKRFEGQDYVPYSEWLALFNELEHVEMVVCPFAFFAKGLVIGSRGLLTPVVEHGNQRLTVGAFHEARDWFMGRLEHALDVEVR